MDKDFDKLCADIEDEQHKPGSGYKDVLYFPITIARSGAHGTFFLNCHQLCNLEVDGGKRKCWFYDEIDMLTTKEDCQKRRFDVVISATTKEQAQELLASYYYDIIKADHEATEDLMGLTQKLIDEEALGIKTPG